jgi:hypothetical protein
VKREALGLAAWGGRARRGRGGWGNRSWVKMETKSEVGAPGADCGGEQSHGRVKPRSPSFYVPSFVLLFILFRSRDKERRAGGARFIDPLASGTRSAYIYTVVVATAIASQGAVH